PSRPGRAGPPHCDPGDHLHALGLGILVAVSSAALPAGASATAALVERVTTALSGGSVLLALALLLVAALARPRRREVPAEDADVAALVAACERTGALTPGPPGDGAPPIARRVVASWS
ncbi:MAG: hypothetical protein ACXV2H_03865, partial [Actinomycetes bacterium]